MYQMRRTAYANSLGLTYDEMDGIGGSRQEYMCTRPGAEIQATEVAAPVRKNTSVVAPFLLLYSEQDYGSVRRSNHNEAEGRIKLSRLYEELFQTFPLERRPKNIKSEILDFLAYFWPFT